MNLSSKIWIFFLLFIALPSIFARPSGNSCPISDDHPCPSVFPSDCLMKISRDSATDLIADPSLLPFPVDSETWPLLPPRGFSPRNNLFMSFYCPGSQNDRADLDSQKNPPFFLLDEGTGKQIPFHQFFWKGADGKCRLLIKPDSTLRASARHIFVVRRFPQDSNLEWLNRIDYPRGVGVCYNEEIAYRAVKDTLDLNHEDVGMILSFTTRSYRELLGPVIYMRNRALRLYRSMTDRGRPNLKFHYWTVLNGLRFLRIDVDLPVFDICDVTNHCEISLDDNRLPEINLKPSRLQYIILIPESAFKKSVNLLLTPYTGGFEDLVNGPGKMVEDYNRLLEIADRSGNALVIPVANGSPGRSKDSQSSSEDVRLYVNHMLRAIMSTHAIRNDLPRMINETYERELIREKGTITAISQSTGEDLVRYYLDPHIDALISVDQFYSGSVFARRMLSDSVLNDDQAIILREAGKHMDDLLHPETFQEMIDRRSGIPGTTPKKRIKMKNFLEPYGKWATIKFLKSL